MRGQQVEARRNGGNVILCVSISFQNALYAVLGSLMKQTFNGNVNKYNGCVSLRYNSLFISLPLSTKGHKRTT